jgi:hypothetical protein
MAGIRQKEFLFGRYPEGIESLSPAVGSRRARLPWELGPEISSNAESVESIPDMPLVQGNFVLGLVLAFLRSEQLQMATLPYPTSVFSGSAVSPDSNSKIWQYPGPL